MKLTEADFLKFPLTIEMERGETIPVYVKAVKPRGHNLWHIQRVAIVKTKRILFSKKLRVVLTWAQIGDFQFLNQKQAENFMTCIVANNRYTAKHMESDIYHSKILDIENDNAG